MSTKSPALGAFIRSRRDATPPDAVGLPPGVRRRAPGLRRSELATLAGISVEYLVRIEQGRDRNPSPQVVMAIADALRLDVVARDHLRNLASVSSGRCTRSTVAGTEVRPGARALLNQLEPGLAALTNRFGDLLTYTSGFELLAGPVGLLEADEPNLTRFVFTDPRARDVFPDWDRVADDRAFNLWMGPSTELAGPLKAELTAAAGAEFTSRIDRPDLPHGGTWRWHHPEAGELRLDCEMLELPSSDAQQLMVLLPADDAAATAVEALRRNTSGSLRAVN